MLSDGMVDLVEKGSITNRRKITHRGRTVCSLAIGSKKLYDFIHKNFSIEMLGINYVNDPQVISSQSRMTAINPSIEIDITGQICADSLGCKMYCGIGGQLDFGRGSSICRDGQGKSIVAFPSVTSSGESRIQPILTPGGGVTTTRSHVHYVVTEYGVAQLFGKTLRQRAYALIEIAHSDHRDCLERAAYERLKTTPTKFL